jgi:3-isopropylmalate dehydrogenase
VDGEEGTWRWTESIPGRHPVPESNTGSVRVGVLPGEGVGPEVVAAAVEVLEAVAGQLGLELVVNEQRAAAPSRGLQEAEVEFCRETFASGGAVLAGAHGGRWVYEIRRRLDLFCKLSPIRPSAEIDRMDSPITPNRLRGVDLLLVREQSGGVYQGSWGETHDRNGARVAEHRFSYRQDEVQRIIEIAVELARRRRGRLAVVVKEGGVPSISELWRECAEAIGGDGVELQVLDADHALYRLLVHPDEHDVVVAPNLFGDLLSDAAGALLGSRGLTYGASFDSAQGAVYQTNHGAARDLAGSDRANPGGQILAAAMMMRESFGRADAAALIERGLSDTWRAGWRTEDIAEPDCRVVGTREMARRVAEGIRDASRAGGAEAGAPRR